jgi:hypothetical protein
MDRTRSLVACIALALASACAEPAAPPAAPDRPALIVNGSPTGSDLYPSVGALMFDYDGDGLEGDDEWCTGSLVAPTIFLTAAHCIVSPWTSTDSEWYVSFAPDLYAKGAKYIKVTGVVYDPQYGRDQANLHDLALVFLPASATRGMTPLRLPRAGVLDVLAAKGALESTLFVNVGYGAGATQTGIPGFPYDGVRKYSYSEFMGLQPTWLGLLMNESATGEGGDCYGDSGGPKFMKGDDATIYATVTTGDWNCRATTWDWRLDTPEARDFLGKYLSLP